MSRTAFEKITPLFFGELVQKVEMLTIHSDTHRLCHMAIPSFRQHLLFLRYRGCEGSRRTRTRELLLRSCERFGRGAVRQKFLRPEVC